MSGNQLFVKICGLQDAHSARAAVEAGADALGFILAPSRRQLDPEAVRAIREELEAIAEFIPLIVGVVVNASASEITALVERSGVDMVQLSGDEDPDILEELSVPTIKTLRVGAGVTRDVARRKVERWLSARSPVRHLIIEGHAVGSYGGSGAMADWTVAAEIATDFPILLAGGLNPSNVRSAIEQVGPAGVDVSSGIETGGTKDPAKIKAFLAAAQSAVS